MIPLSWYLVVAFMLVGLGAYGMIVKRDLIRILISAEIMANGVNIAFVAFSLYYPVFSITGQGFIVIVVAISAIHTTLAMVLLLMFYRRYKSVDLGRAVLKEAH